MMFYFSKLSTLSILGSLLLASTCVQAMDKPEDLSFAAKRALTLSILEKKNQKPAVETPTVVASTPGKLVLPADLENLGASEGPVLQAAPQGPVVEMKRGAPPPPPGPMVKKAPGQVANNTIVVPKESPEKLTVA